MQNITGNNLVCLSYGNENEHRRALFSVLSFFSWYEGGDEDFRVVIYTDKPEFFQAHLNSGNIEYYLLTPDVLESMMEGTGYIHRRKVAVIDLTAQRYPDENLFFIDSDTFFISDPKPLLLGLEAGQSFMHKREYTIADGLALFTSFNQGEHPKAFVDYISKNSFLIGGTPAHFGPSDYCWNSGVLGLHPDFFSYLPDVYRMTDRFHANSKWFISEQLAFSFALQRKTEIRPSDEFVLHYWGKRQKVLLDGLLTELFKQKTVNDLANRSFVRSLTIRWKNAIDNDLIIEQAVISIATKAWYSALKKILQLTLKNPFNLSLYMDIRNELKLK